ncbi:hypothetical protein EZV73_01120 [Acidaminobacter sp. JC074]|uniref:YciI family protein n=1 Tax=Acidaminobacter sp. JC074 TaxID=2530199 RepID=UPI001F0DF99C|nr:YciI family protein [Acidaminobacter sp. JC074]MCH4886143.1 hypothetical protein [Acidaminobacter sp. JC074]
MHYIYKLQLIDRLVGGQDWTEEDEKIVERHFHKLQDLKKEGILILAGRTTHDGPDTFGIVILNADEVKAREIMLNDPAVKEGIMTAELYPYRVALISEDNV